MDTLIISGFILLFLFIVVLSVVFVATTRVVPQEERLVIYRLGRFHRIAGPGLVQIIPFLDQVVRTIVVRDHPLEITVPDIFVFGIPNDLTFNLWCSFNPVQASGNDRQKLIKLVQINESEYRRQIEVKTREALVRQIANLQEQMPLPNNATLLDKVIALAPGSVRYKALLKGLRHELERTLPSVGVILNTAQSIVLTKRNIPDEITEAIERRFVREIDSEWLANYIDEIRQRFPELPLDTILAQLLSSIEGIDIGKIQRVILEQATERDLQEVQIFLSGDPSLLTRERKSATIGALAPMMKTRPQEVKVYSAHAGSIIFNLGIPSEAAKHFRSSLQSNSAQLQVSTPLGEIEKVKLPEESGRIEEWVNLEGRFYLEASTYPALLPGIVHGESLKAKSTEVEVEFEMSGSGEAGPNIITKPQVKKTQDVITDHQPAYSATQEYPDDIESRIPPVDKTERIEAYAVARIQGYDNELPFYLGEEYLLQTGILGKILKGFVAERVTLPSQETTQINITVHAQDMDVEPDPMQTFTYRQGRETDLLEFRLTPREVGQKQIRVEFYYQQHWLAQIKFEVEVMAATEAVPA